MAIGKAWVTCPLLKLKQEAGPMHISVQALGAGVLDTEWAKTLGAHPRSVTEEAPREHGPEGQREACRQSWGREEKGVSHQREQSVLGRRVN